MIWIFHGTNSRFSSGVFSNRQKADAWIRLNKLSGLLTAYPMDESVYDWAIRQGLFSPKQAKEKTPEFIQSFSSAGQEHYHYEDGSLDS